MSHYKELYGVVDSLAILAEVTDMTGLALTLYSCLFNVSSSVTDHLHKNELVLHILYACGLPEDCDGNKKYQKFSYLLYIHTKRAQLPVAIRAMQTVSALATLMEVMITLFFESKAKEVVV